MVGCGAGRELLEEQAGALVGALGRLAVAAPAAATRVAALDVLAAALALPWAALHAHRGAAQAALAAAADDRKRAVRAAAVRCRRAWAPS
jgi:hypothetical protein